MADKILDLDCSLKLVSSSISLNLERKSSTDRSKILHQLLQVKLEQLTVQSPVAWAQITYIDPLSRSQQQVVKVAETPLPFSPDILVALRSQAWLVEFPQAFSLHQIVCDSLENIVVYFCPYGYQQQQCQYLLVVAKDFLSLRLQQYIQQTAVLVSEYLERHLETLQQQHQIQFLEQIIQGLGHSLRQQLSLIGLYAENLDRALPQGRLQNQAAIIRETTQDLDRNLTEMIYFSGSETLRFTLQDLRGLVVESLRDFQAWIAEKQLQVNYPDTSVVLSLNRLQMKQVFDNLLSNAIHFSPNGSTIAINWQVFHSEVLISIADEGTGLSPADLQNLFTPFYHRRPGGTGLGLAIAQKVVLAHQGKLWAKNLPVKGAEFSLILPRSITST